MTTEQLPEGLSIAVEMIGECVESVVTSSRNQATGKLDRRAEMDQRNGAEAIAAIRAEHAQRSAQEQRIAELEAKMAADRDARDALRTNRDELLVALHGIGQALGIPESDRSPYSITCGALECVNRLAEIEAQEPACWAVIDPIGGSSVEYTAAWREACHEHIGSMITEADMPEAANFLVRPLYANPVPAQAVPTGERQAVPLEDWQLAAAMCEIPPGDELAAGFSFLSWQSGRPDAASALDEARLVQAAVLAANGLEVRRG